jgi:SAM-dependent methyltransferase
MPDLDPCHISVATFDKLASRYADKYFDLTLYDAHLARFAGCVASNTARVLDLACGPGNVSAFLQRIRPNWQLTGIDLAPGMLAQARARVPGVEFLLGDCRQLEQLQRSFDAAAWAFGLSYLLDDDARRCLASLHAILAADAPMYLSTITGPAACALEASGTGEQVYMVYRPPGAVMALVEEAGFCIDFHELIASPANAGKATQDLVLVARKV